MKHRSITRPVLPGTTPAPAPLGKSSVYATRVPAQLEPISRSNQDTNTGSFPPSPKSDTDFAMRDRAIRNIRTPSETTKQRAVQEKALNQMTAKLPFELRESVTAVVRMAFSASQRMQEDLDLNNQELLALRAEVASKSRENHTLHKSCENYREQIRGMQENIESLKDEIATRQNFTIRNRSAMTRLASTNRMLIDVLDALQASSGPGGNNTKLLQELARQAEIDVEDEALTEGTDKNGRKQKLAPLLVPRSPKLTDPVDYEEKVQRKTMFQNDKLRESLLKVAREHYRSTKNAEVLENKVMELKAALRTQENLNRKLKSELDEIKILHKLESDSMDEVKPELESAKSFRIKSFGQIDQRFQALLDRNVFDPIEGILQLRRILAHMSSSPSSLSLFDMIDHIVNSDVARIFDADMVCLFLIKPGADTVMHKFTSRSKAPVTVDLANTRSVAAETIRNGKVQRINILSNSAAYNSEVDGCTGVLTKRVMSLPLFHSQNLTVLGCVQFLNKAQGRDAFAEVDELFGVIFANQCAVHLTECVMYDAMFFHAQLLQGLLEASTELFSIVPDPTSLLAQRPLLPGEILGAMERIARELLKCPHTRAFLLSDIIRVGEREQLIMLPQVRSSTMSQVPRITEISAVPMHAGIAGHVIATKKPYLLENSGLDDYWSPQCDLDPLGDPMLTVPLLDLHGRVLGCLQLVASGRSPRIKQSNDVHDFRLLFSQAAHWLAHQMAPALDYLLSFTDQPVRQPTATPSKLSRSSIDTAFRPSFFSSSDEVVSQILAAETGDYRPSLSSTCEGAVAGEEAFITMSAQSIGLAGGDDFPAIRSESRLPSAGQRVHFISTHEATVQTSFSNLERETAPDMVSASAYNEAMELLQVKNSEIAQLQQLLEEKEGNASSHDQNLMSEFEAHKEEYNILKEEIARMQADSVNVRKQMMDLCEAREKEQLELDALQSENAKLTQERDEFKQQYQISLSRETTREKSLNDSIQQMKQEWKLEKDRLDASLSSQTQAAAEQAQLIQQLQNTIAGLQRDLAQRDKVQAILQDQVVKLAGQNIKEIHAAIEKDQPDSIPIADTENKEATAVSLSFTEKSQTTSLAPVPAPGREADAEEGGRGIVSSKELQTSDERFGVSESPRGSSNAEKISSDFVGEQKSQRLDPPLAESSGSDKIHWIRQVDSLGREYFYNNKTGESSWELPEGIVAGSAPLRKGDWLQQFDELGREYWINQVSGVSAWEIPADDSLANNNDGIEDEDEEEVADKLPHGPPSIFDTNASQYSATAGDYTIEL